MVNRCRQVVRKLLERGFSMIHPHMPHGKRVQYKYLVKTLYYYV